MSRLVVSLTSTVDRLSLCNMALFSLCNQSLKPDAIVVWLSKEAYLRDSGVKNTDDAIAILKRGLSEEGQRLIEIGWVSNTGPYRKLMPAVKQFSPEDIIVTADDDIMYGSSWLSSLMKQYDPSKPYVVAARAVIQKRNIFGVTTSYLHWCKVTEKSTFDSDWLVTFGGGSVIKVEWLKDLVLEESFKVLAPTSDDIWFSKLLKLGGIGVVVAPAALEEVYFMEHDDGLVNDNIILGSGFLSKIYLHIVLKGLGYLGFSVCGNDVAYKSVESYFRTGSDIGDSTVSSKVS